MSRMSGFNGSAVLDAGSIADGNEQASTITVPGARLGDFVLVSCSLDLQDLDLGAAVTASNVVTYVLGNDTGGAIDLGSATYRVKVIPFDVA